MLRIFGVIMSGNKQALIVDLDEERGPLVRELFARRRFDARVVSSVEAVASVLREHEIDAVLVLWTPVWNTFREVLSRICSSHPEAVVVVSCLRGDLSLAIELLKAGARECLTAPVPLPELVTAVEAALHRHFLAVRPWYNQSVMAIAAAIGLRDVETEEHCHRVATTTVRLCRVLGITEEKHCQAIRWGAYLYDVGKVGIPDNILHKQGSLDTQETQVMRRHPEIGRALLQRIPFLTDSIPLVLHHHEHFDGTGCPAGLRRGEIPLEARAIAVADTVDAMLNKRPYRSAMSWDEVVEELRRNRGRQFDPEVVDLALSHSHEVFQVYGWRHCDKAVLC